MGKLISMTAFAKLVNVSKQQISKDVKLGKLTTQDGKIVEDVALQEWWILHPEKTPAEKSTNPSGKHSNTQEIATTGKEIQSSKAIKEHYTALSKKREYEILEKHYIHIDQVCNEIEIASAIVRSKLLALPNKLATELEDLKHHEIQTLLENEINDCFIDLTELAEEYRELQANVKEKETNRVAS